MQYIDRKNWSKTIPNAMNIDLYLLENFGAYHAVFKPNFWWSLEDPLFGTLCTCYHDRWLMWKSFSEVDDLMVKLRKWNHQIDISGIWMYWREWNNVQTCYSFTDWITASFSLVAVVSSCCAMCCVCDSGILVVLLILSALLTSVALLLFYDFEQPCDKAVLNSTVRI